MIKAGAGFDPVRQIFLIRQRVDELGGARSGDPRQ
jgi:hypothetical protein